MRWQVRDIYDAGDYLVLVTTDRQSAFDRILASIPFKGQVCDSIQLFSVFFTCIWFFGQFYSKYDYIRNVNTFFDKASNWRSSHCEELFQSPLFFVFSVNVVSVSFFVLISYFPFLHQKLSEVFWFSKP